MEMSELLERFVNHHKLFRMEGEQGISNLCKIVEALGYKDKSRFGRQVNGTYIGSLLLFLEDNPGAIEVLFEWIQNQNSEMWKEQMGKCVPRTAIDEDEEAQT